MKRTKLQKIIAVYERFGADIASVPDAQAKMLHRTSMGAGKWVADLLSKDPAPRPSEIASGMEQGLRDTADFIRSVAMEWRATVMKAFHAAVSMEYPEFHSKDRQRLGRVLARKKIRTEAEFYLIRHQVDVLEGETGSDALVKVLYALIDDYEARA